MNNVWIATPFSTIVTANLVAFKTLLLELYALARKKQCLFFCVIVCLGLGSAIWTSSNGVIHSLGAAPSVMNTSQKHQQKLNANKAIFIALGDFGAQEIQNLLLRVNYFQYSPRFHEQGYAWVEANDLYHELKILYHLAVTEQMQNSNNVSNNRAVILADIVTSLNALIQLMDRYLFDQGFVDDVSRQHLFSLQKSLARLRQWHYYQYAGQLNLQAYKTDS